VFSALLLAAAQLSHGPRRRGVFWHIHSPLAITFRFHSARPPWGRIVGLALLPVTAAAAAALGHGLPCAFGPLPQGLVECGADGINPACCNFVGLDRLSNS
jgi:hypothetical protein